MVDSAADEITAAGRVLAGRCKQCGNPFDATPHGRRIKREFCQDKCRANYRLEDKRRAVDRLLKALEEAKADLVAKAAQVADLAADIERLAAVTEGAIKFVQMHLVIGHRKKSAATREK